MSCQSARSARFATRVLMTSSGMQPSPCANAALTQVARRFVVISSRPRRPSDSCNSKAARCPSHRVQQPEAAVAPKAEHPLGVRAGKPGGAAGKLVVPHCIPDPILRLHIPQSRHHPDTPRIMRWNRNGGGKSPGPQCRSSTCCAGAQNVQHTGGALLPAELLQVDRV